MQVQIQTLGETQVRINGREVHWRAHSARDLLLYLLSYPEGRTRRQILDSLWAADLSTRTNNRFRVTLHRLRTTLGGPDSVTEHSGRFQLSPDVWRASDVFRLYWALDSAEHDHDPARQTEALEQAVALYHGDYLPEHEAEWAEQARQEHRAAYVHAHLELSRLYCLAGDCALSVRALSVALRADPYAGEAHHQRLMTCLSVVADTYQATDAYRRFKKFLREDLQDEPLPETQALARRVSHGDHLCQRAMGLLAARAQPWPTPLAPDSHGPAEWHSLLASGCPQAAESSSDDLGSLN